MNSKQILEEGLRLLGLIQHCLQEELRLAVELRLELLAENTIRKEALVQSWNRWKKNHWSTVEITAGDEPLRESFRDAWRATVKSAEENLIFLRHSVRTLHTSVDHFRNLLGDNILYSQKGQKVGPDVTGRVLENKY